MTEAEWRNVDEAFIERMDALDSHVLVDQLRHGDNDAWRYVYARAVLPMLKRPSLGKMVTDRNRSDLEICGAVFEYLVAKKKLDLYDFKCPVVYWIRFWVAKDILEYCRKNDNPVSDEGLEGVLIDGRDAFAINELREEINLCYRRLREEEPPMARVLYLKVREERPSKDIAKLLNTSSANVDQLYSRARKKMREYLAASQEVQTFLGKIAIKGTKGAKVRTVKGLKAVVYEELP